MVKSIVIHKIIMVRVPIALATSLQNVTSACYEIFAHQTWRGQCIQWHTGHPLIIDNSHHCMFHYLHKTVSFQMVFYSLQFYISIQTLQGTWGLFRRRMAEWPNYSIKIYHIQKPATDQMPWTWNTQSNKM